MYKAVWLYTVAVKCSTTVVQRRSREREKCRDKYININTYATVGKLFSSETARGKKLFLCLEVLANSDLLRLPEGRCLNRLCPGCEGSAVIFPARFLTLEVYRSWMVGRLAPMIFSADLTVRWSL